MIAMLDARRIPGIKCKARLVQPWTNLDLCRCATRSAPTRAKLASFESHVSQLQGHELGVQRQTLKYTEENRVARSALLIVHRHVRRVDVSRSV